MYDRSILDKPYTGSMIPPKHQSSRSFAENFLGLPKELRELVYVHVLSNSAPVPLEDAAMNSTGQALLALGRHPRDPSHEAEVLEAYHTYSVFSVRFLDHKDNACLVAHGNTRCLCAVRWLPVSQHYRHVRNLVIHSQEAGIDLVKSYVSSMEDLESMYSNCHSRRCWEQLLAMPRLERLTIQLQKLDNNYFVWASFTPILSLLRERSPKLQISLNISFDDILSSYWYDPIWQDNTEPGSEVEILLYDPMGFTDILELLEEPTEEDIAYIAQRFAGELRTSGRDIRRGLLDETPAQRRALAPHYVVKEPALLKVRVKNHYEVYKKMKPQEVHQDV